MMGLGTRKRWGLGGGLGSAVASSFSAPPSLEVGLIFQLPLTDSGAGAVNTAVARSGGSGTPTFTRASTAWTKLSTGLWASVATGIARSVYTGASTAVGTYGGYFAEAAGTQLVTPTASIRDMTDASWIKVTMTTAKTSTGIDGVANSCTRLTATGATSTILQTLVAAATSRTYSCFIKRITGTGTINLAQGVTTSDITAQINSSTFTCVSLNASVLNAAFGIQIITSGDAIDVDFNQFEAGAIATSPMDAAGAVRVADSLTYVLAGNIDLTVGSIYAEAFSIDAVSQQRVVSGAGGTFTGMSLVAGQQTRVNDGTTLVASGSGVTLGNIGKMAINWTGATMKSIMNGGTIGSGAFDGNLSMLTSLAIGSVSGQAASCGVKNARIWNRALSNTELTQATT